MNVHHPAKASSGINPAFADLYATALASHIGVAESLHRLAPEVVRAAECIATTYLRGGKVLLCGNGGSAADAQHWATEWMVRLDPNATGPARAAIALSSDSSVMSACANDFGFDEVFARQVEGLGKPEDTLIVISTSGDSRNIQRAVQAAASTPMFTLGVLGKGGGAVASCCDLALIVPSNDIQSIQEMHTFLGHQLCALSQRLLAGGQDIA